IFAVVLGIGLAVLYIGAHGQNLLRLAPEWNVVLRSNNQIGPGASQQGHQDHRPFRSPPFK
ncbi:MAG: hypothetical protein KDE01_13310, partial [Caldilineaceae bacterium]|nr:hypothetical protein [Caldilineaceae bacterium]